MRPSNRIAILDAAATVVQREGVTRLTLESVADEAGLTKGGLMYHFPTREALLQAVHEHLAAQWDGAIHSAAGEPADTLSPDRRLAAYIEVATHSGTRSELLFMLEAVDHPDHVSPWLTVMNRWTPPPPSATPATGATGATGADTAALTAFVARLAADGL